MYPFVISYFLSASCIFDWDDLPAAGSIFVSMGGGRMMGKVFQCQRTSFAKSTTGFMYSKVSAKQIKFVEIRLRMLT